MIRKRRRQEHPGQQHCGQERGSALLIVFLFAAMVAIMLYMELPVAAFEAQRNKEQLLIDRGNEYAHAVKLFVRKFGMYPSSIDQLENTNRMRFLRRRFKDPLTGKDDWRLLHAGPNGQLLDSKVNPIGNSSNGTGSNSGMGSFGSSSTSTSSGFASGGSNSSSSSNSSSADVVVASVPQRPPAIAANGGGLAPNPLQADQNPMTPLMPPGQSSAQVGQASGQNTGQPGAAVGAPAGSANSMDAIRNLLNNPNPTPQTGTSQTSAPQTTSVPAGSYTMGAVTGGGFAGVASKAEGHSIKTVNDQVDYSLWEFYYDPTKDLTRGIANAAQAGAAQAAAQVAAQNSGNQNATTTSAPATCYSAAIGPSDIATGSEPAASSESAAISLCAQAERLTWSRPSGNTEGLVLVKSFSVFLSNLHSWPGEPPQSFGSTSAMDWEKHQWWPAKSSALYWRSP